MSKNNKQGNGSKINQNPSQQAKSNESIDSSSPENQNVNHNSKKESLGRNTKR